MDLKTIHLMHYRNYHDTVFPLGKHTIFIGPNGSGKTNVIEAVRTISVTKSFRVEQDRDAIEWDQSYCRLTLETSDDKMEYILTREEYGTKKVMKRNGTIIPLTQVYGVVPTVLFSPETMRLIDGSPQERRRFLDTLLSQADRDYLESLMTYRKVMRERHFVLLRLQQGLGSNDELDFWDQELVRTGSYIVEQRRDFLDQINTLLLAIYPRFIDPTNTERLVLRYKPSVFPDEYAKRLHASRFQDTKTGTTLWGPHRDEIIFLLADRDITLFASRGELRRSVLATKLAEARYLHDLKGKEPVLLLDDVFSELDEARRTSFLRAIAEYQTMITTTDQEFILSHALDGAVVHTLPLEQEPSATQEKKPKKEKRGSTT